VDNYVKALGERNWINNHGLINLAESTKEGCFANDYVGF
jgi:hypothetical protein